MRRFLIFVGAWMKAVPMLAHIWWRRACRRMEWRPYLLDMVSNPERSHALGEMIAREFAGHQVEFALYSEHGPEKDGKNPIWWEAPTTYTVYVAEKPAFGLGLEFLSDRIDIRQLQGVQGAVIPDQLRKWPFMFLFACINFAQQQGIKEVRLYRASETIFYKHPVGVSLPGFSRKDAVKVAQERMRLRYDGTARRAKLLMKQKYGVWINPDSKLPASS